MKEGNTENIIYSKSVIEFATVANEFCNYIDKQQNVELKPFLSTLQKLLPLLYLKTSVLPDISDEDVETPEKYLTEVDYNFLLNKLSVKLGAHDSFLEVFDPGMQFSETPIESSIAENLCDIYQDLKDFVFAFRLGTNELMSGALWECKNNFEEFWGQKLVNVLRAIHSLLFSGALNETEDQNIDDTYRSDSWVSKHFKNQADDEVFSDNDL